LFLTESFQRTENAVKCQCDGKLVAKDREASGPLKVVRAPLCTF
jgi:hypothetical protein